MLDAVIAKCVFTRHGDPAARERVTTLVMVNMEHTLK